MRTLLLAFRCYDRSVVVTSSWDNICVLIAPEMQRQFWSSHLIECPPISTLTQYVMFLDILCIKSIKRLFITSKFAKYSPQLRWSLRRPWQFLVETERLLRKRKKARQKSLTWNDRIDILYEIIYIEYIISKI